MTRTTIDGNEAAAHVARHHPLLEGQEDDALFAAGMVEVVPREFGVALHFRPAQGCWWCCWG